jgi:S1-C subfamily serine protease
MPDLETAAWPRAEHLHRVFQVRSGSSLGTAFALDVEGRQYLISALHVVSHSTSTAALDIYYLNAWKSFPVNIVGIDFDNDIAVFALEQQVVADELAIHVSSFGCVAGQEVFILGYPLGLRGQTYAPGFPIPLVKRGIVALFHPGPPRSAYVSVSANPGFSGGPVYFAHQQTGRATLMSIVLEEFGYEVPVKNAQGEEVGKVLTASNITNCSFIDHALALIRDKPTGFPII